MFITRYVHSNTILRYVAVAAMMSGLLLASPGQSAAGTNAKAEYAQQELYEIALVLHNAVDSERDRYTTPVTVAPETFTKAESAIRNVQEKETGDIKPHGKLAILALNNAVNYLSDAKKQWRDGDARLAMEQMKTALDFIDTAAQYYHLQMQ